jgi:signal peptidase I
MEHYFYKLLLQSEGSVNLNFIKDWIIPLAIACLLALAINKFVLFKIKVPTGSMIPTIQISDQIFALRVYNPSHLKRGDVVVFYSDELHMRLVKRLIGLPGEKVELKDGGKLYINDKKVEEPYVINKDSMNKSFQVPKEHYLFLGDNRPISLDARYWKNPYIPANKIEGRAVFRVYPLNKIGILKR